MDRDCIVWNACHLFHIFGWRQFEMKKVSSSNWQMMANNIMLFFFCQAEKNQFDLVYRLFWNCMIFLASIQSNWWDVFFILFFSNFLLFFFNWSTYWREFGFLFLLETKVPNVNMSVGLHKRKTFDFSS